MVMEHAALYVKDLEGAKVFFETYFQGEAGEKYGNVKTGFTSYFMSFAGGARLEIMNAPSVSDGGERESPRTGYAHIAFRTGSRENVDRLTERLRRDGFQVISGPRKTGDGYYESCIMDLEGNYIEITA